jgi:hypothetical protein
MLKAYIRDWPVEKSRPKPAQALSACGAPPRAGPPARQPVPRVRARRAAPRQPALSFLECRDEWQHLRRLFCVTNFGESHGPAIGCVIDGCPPGLALGEADIQPELDRRRPGTSRHVTQRNEADAGRDPVGRLRRPDHRHADLPADPQHRPAQQGLRQHPRHLSPRPCRLHLLAQVRPARPARRRPLIGAADRAHGGRRRGGAQVAAPAARHQLQRLDEPARRAPIPFEDASADPAQPVLRPQCQAIVPRWRPTWTRCARPATAAARASRCGPSGVPPAWASRCTTSSTPTSPTR